MRISTSLLFRQGVEAMLEQQAKLARTQNQVARGERILSPSDDPAGAGRLVDLNQALVLARRFQTNADTARTRLANEEAALTGVEDLLNRVRELALSAQNDTIDASGREAIASEIRVRLDELVQLANTRDASGEHLFGGFRGATRPFVRSGGTFLYQGDDGQRRIQVGPEVRIADSDPGSEVFMRIPTGNGTFRVRDGAANAGSGVADAGTVTDPAAFVPDTYTITFLAPDAFEVRDSGGALVTSGAFASGDSLAFLGIELTIDGVPAAGDTFTVTPSATQDLFTTLETLATELEASRFTQGEKAGLHNAVNRALADLDRGLERLSVTRAAVGARLDAIESERDINADLALRVEENISRVKDLDLAEAVSRLTRERTVLEAAQRSFAAIQDLSLFRFL